MRNGRARWTALGVGLAFVLAMVLSACVLATTTTMIASSTTLTEGQAITLTARVTSTTTPAGTVMFRDGSTTIGSAPLSAGVASFTTSALSPGVHQLSAHFAGQGTWAASASTPFTVTVQALGTRYQLSLGDSLAVGVGAPSGQGYVARILAHE